MEAKNLWRIQESHLHQQSFTNLRPGTPDQWHDIAQCLTTARASAAEKILAGWKFSREIAWFLCHLGIALKHPLFTGNVPSRLKREILLVKRWKKFTLKNHDQKKASPLARSNLAFNLIWPSGYEWRGLSAPDFWVGTRSFAKSVAPHVSAASHCPHTSASMQLTVTSPDPGQLQKGTSAYPANQDHLSTLYRSALWHELHWCLVAANSELSQLHWALLYVKIPRAQPFPRLSVIFGWLFVGPPRTPENHHHLSCFGCC